MMAAVIAKYVKASKSERVTHLVTYECGSCHFTNLEVLAYSDFSPQFSHTGYSVDESYLSSCTRCKVVNIVRM